MATACAKMVGLTHEARLDRKGHLPYVQGSACWTFFYVCENLRLIANFLVGASVHYLKTTAVVVAIQISTITTYVYIYIDSS